ncbi:MAG TPA: nicotinamidase [Candidatus Hydrogenedentes bacterium]|nr:nicotinamidase [Candidatus Hydrogenedentota bacterium]HPG67951.1 nicotinamidase [Candidatus Hydrogenedentota bacterium]
MTQIVSSDALIVTDIQRDFCPGGALAVAGGDEIVPMVNALVGKFRHVFYTRDWHPADHCSFADGPEFQDGSWPAHCVRDTPGAAFHPELAVAADAEIVSKATDSGREAYSSFQGTDLVHRLRARGVNRVFLCGIATDYCVKASALDAVSYGFEVMVVEDACRGVDVPTGSAAAAMEAMREAGAALCRAGDLV